MVTNAPTGSISGDNEWEWNKWQDATRTRQTDAPSRRPPQTRTDTPREDPTYRDLVVDLHRENRKLEAEIERRDRRLEDITTQYERLLEERDRKLAERTPDTTDADSLVGRMSGLVRRLNPL